MTGFETLKYTPEVGRYEGLSENEYHGCWDAWNVSRLKALKQTPAHCLEMMQNPPVKKSAALRDGSALHCAILEPERFESSYRVDPESPKGGYPSGWRNTNDYKGQVAQLRSEGITPLPLDIRDRCHFVRDRIYGEPSHACDLLSEQSGAEVSYAVDDAETGLRCKIRNDLEVKSAGIICDLKKTESIAGFEKQVWDLSYYLSVPHYMDLMETFEPGVWNCHVFLAIELKPPYEFHTVSLRPEALDFARRERARLMETAEECQRTGEWPGYCRSVEYLDLPAYAYTQEQFE